MRSETVQFLLDLNHRFYQTFGGAFAATRRRVQPGVRRVMAGLAEGARLLDLGCGSGALALELRRQGRAAAYLGLDASEPLLNEARAALTAGEEGGMGGMDIRFAAADLADPGWAGLAAGEAFTAVLAFAVLHHLPGDDLRERLLRQVNALLPAGGRFIHSEWQFQHSPRLLARMQPWESLGLDPAELDEGDTLLDWRYTLPGQVEGSGLRYVHLFTRAELAALAEASGFEIIDEFESDGEGGRLGLYQSWGKIHEFRAD